MIEPSAEEQLVFLTKIQRLFAEGDFTATYKFALLISIADYAVQNGDVGGDELLIPNREIGKRFVELYWQQCTPFNHSTPLNDGVLLQNNHDQASVVSKILEYRNKNFKLTAALKSEELITYVTAKVKENPIKRLQKLGGIDEIFIYEETKGHIRLLPGVTYCLRRFQPLIQQLCRTNWIAQIKSISKNNALIDEKIDLEEFLFQTSRQSLAIVETGLRKISDKCFYCNGSVSKADVDHFIPYSLYPRDLVHNFVLADPKCNRSKSDTLAAKNHLNKWLEFIDTNTERLNDIGFEAGIMGNSKSTESIAKWGYTNGFSGESKAWVASAQYEPIDNSYLSLFKI